MSSAAINRKISSTERVTHDIGFVMQIVFNRDQSSNDQRQTNPSCEPIHFNIYIVFAGSISALADLVKNPIELLGALSSSTVFPFAWLGLDSLIKELKE